MKKLKVWLMVAAIVLVAIMLGKPNHASDAMAPVPGASPLPT